MPAECRLQRALSEEAHSAPFDDCRSKLNEAPPISLHQGEREAGVPQAPARQSQTQEFADESTQANDLG